MDSEWEGLKKSLRDLGTVGKMYFTCRNVRFAVLSDGHSSRKRQAK